MNKRYPTEPARKAPAREEEDPASDDGLPPEIFPPDPDGQPLSDQGEPLPHRTGSDTRALGPSDSTDSGSDFASGRAAGAEELLSDSDAAGTGERAGVGRHDGEAADTSVDRIVGSEEAGLGGGLDQAEEAQRVPDGRRSAKDVPV